MDTQLHREKPMLTSFHVKQLGRVQAQNASRPCTGRQTLAAVGNARRQGRGSLRSDRGQPTPPGVSCWPALYTCIISCSLQCKQRGPTQNQAPLVQGNAMAHPRMLLACCGLHLPVPPGQGPHIALLGPQPWAPLCAPIRPADVACAAGRQLCRTRRRSVRGCAALWQRCALTWRPWRTPRRTC